MQALTLADINLEGNTLRVHQTYRRRQSVDILTCPKTDSSIRTVTLPQLLVDELREYIDGLYKPEDNSRLFPISKSALHREIDRCAEAAGLKRITVHGFRHSHIPLLANLGVPEISIANRVGHAKNTMTSRYSDSYTSKATEIATMLNKLMEETENVGESERREEALA